MTQLYTRRPDDLKKKIAEVFGKLTATTVDDNWTCRGSSEYLICKIDEFALFQLLVRSNPEQKEFTILDVGAGNYKFGRILQDKINQDRDLPQDIKVKIFSLGGERHDDTIKAESADLLCALYEYESFEIENIIDQFQTRGIDIVNSADLIVSNWCLQHLVDPLGTLEQLYLIAKKDGYILSGGFYARTVDHFNDDPNGFLASILYNTGDPLLIHPHNENYSTNHFLLQKTHDSSPFEKLEYSSYEGLGSARQVYSGSVVTFDDTKLPLPKLIEDLEYYCGKTLFGSRNLYDKLRDNSCFYREEGSANYGDIMEYVGGLSEVHDDIS